MMRTMTASVLMLWIMLASSIPVHAAVTFPSVDSGAGFADEARDWGVEPTLLSKGHPYHGPTPLSIPGARVIRTLPMKSLLEAEPSVVVIDVLNARSRNTVPGAYWMPGSGNGRFNDDLASAFGVALEVLSGGDKERPLVFLCQGAECWESYNAAQRAVRLGYTDVIWYRGGSRSWQAAGFTREKPLPFEWTGGRDMEQVARTLTNFGALYQAEGRYARAEAMYQRALAIREKALGSEALVVGEALSSLGSLYQSQGRYSAAEALYERALDISRKASGRDSSEAAQMLANMGQLYQAQGRYAGAEALFKQEVSIREKVLGPMHTDVASALARLGTMEKVQGRYAEAEVHFERALTIREQKSSGGGFELAHMLNNMGELYAKQGRYAAAEPFYRRALSINEALGTKARELARTLGNLALVARAQGRYEEAEALFARAEAITKAPSQSK